MRKEEKLTDRQLETYNFIINFMCSNGYAPSLREIARGIYASKPIAKKHLDALIDKGYLRYTPRTARSIVIIEHEKIS